MNNSPAAATRLKVLDLGRFLAGPVAATLLGDLGAEVIKVERPRVGDPVRYVHPPVPDDPGMSYEWLIEGRNKRSITLDLAKPQGRDLLIRLAQWADVLVENFRPGMMQKWGLSYLDLAAVNPRLVYVSISGFGATGPYSDRLGFDFVGAAFGGLTYVTGYGDRPPATSGFALCDMLAGTFGALGALEAVRRRDTPGGTGRGEWIDLGLYEPILRFATPWIPYFVREGKVRERESSMPPQDGREPQVVWGYIYGTRDGQWVAMVPNQHDDSAQNRLLRAIQRADLLDDPRIATRDGARANVRLVDEVIRDWCAKTDLAEVVVTLSGAEIPCSPVNSIADICSDPHVLARNLVTVPDRRGRPVTMQGVVPRLVNNPGTIESVGEELGASNQYVYGELLGLDPVQLESLTADGVI